MSLRGGVIGALAAAMLLSASIAKSEESCSVAYYVKPGDTLVSLATEYLGTAWRFQEIHSRNQAVIGPDPDMLRVGTMIQIPCSTSAKLLDWSLLPDATTVSELQKLSNLQVVDIRPAGIVAEDGLIPGALSIPFSRWRGPKENPGSAPSVTKLNALLGKTGLRVDRPIVVVHSKDEPFDMGRAAFVYWALKSAGAQQLAILSGGYLAWTDAALPVARTPRRARPYRARITPDNTWTADFAEVSAIASGQRPGVLLDARPEGIYARRNTSGQSVPSTLPGASNSAAGVAFSSMSARADKKLGVLEVLSHLKHVDVNWESEPVINFCYTGELAALNWFYASELTGIENVKLYPESTKGWMHKGRQLSPAQ